MKTAYFHHINRPFPPWEWAVNSMGMGSCQHGNVLFTRREPHHCAVQENFLRRAEMFLAPCGYGISSVQKGAPEHASWTVDSGIVDSFQPYRSIVFREKKQRKVDKIPKFRCFINEFSIYGCLYIMYQVYLNIS